MEKALTKVGSLKVVVGSSWITKKAKEEFSCLTEDITTLSNTVEDKAKWIFNKLKGKPVKSLPDLLQEYNLPRGLFPQNITCYEFDESKAKLIVYLPSVCEVSFKDSSVIRYATRVKAILGRGKLMGIEGMKTKVLVWVKVTNLAVEGYKSDKVWFTAGVKKSRPIDVYQMPRDAVRVLHPCAESININNKVWNVYFRDLLPRLVKAGDDGNYGSAAVCDSLCLQALSKRIHYGKFVAEAKFIESPALYEAAIRVQDRSQLIELLTYETVEEAVKKRVEMKAKIFGQDVKIKQEEDVADPAYKIKPSLVADLFGDWIMPLTKQVQVEYLLRRLD